jgi:hypothetical protein
MRDHLRHRMRDARELAEGQEQATASARSSWGRKRQGAKHESSNHLFCGCAGGRAGGRTELHQQQRVFIGRVHDAQQLDQRKREQQQWRNLVEFERGRHIVERHGRGRQCQRDHVRRRRRAYRHGEIGGRARQQHRHGASGRTGCRVIVGAG